MSEKEASTPRQYEAKVWITDTRKEGANQSGKRKTPHNFRGSLVDVLRYLVSTVQNKDSEGQDAVERIQVEPVTASTGGTLDW